MSKNLIFEHPRALVYCDTWQNLQLPSRSVDVVLTDPPYDAHTQKNIRSCKTNGKLKVQEWTLNFEPLADMSHVPALLDVCQRWVVCFSSLELVGDYMRAAGGHRQDGGGYVRGGTWRKKQAAPQLSGDRPAGSCESFVIMHPPGGKMHWNGGGKHAYLSSHQEDAGAPFYVPDFVEAGRERAKKRHAAQKPDALCDKLAEWFVNPDDVVLDAYCGSGALGMAALRRGATVIFADIDPEWAVFTADRVSQYLTEIDRTAAADLTAQPPHGTVNT